MSGHFDVVRAANGWSVDPFGGVVRDGKINGRGACDMKAGDRRRPPGAFVSVPVALVIVAGFWHAMHRREWGLDPRALLPGARATVLFTLPAVVLLLASGAALDTLQDCGDFLGNLAGLVVWGAAQQWILQTVVVREAQRATARERRA
jgi:hypothetical protein